MTRFTADEAKILSRAAHAVWNEIGGDCLQALGEGDEGITIERDTVVELVLDASRFEERLRRDRVDPALIERVKADIYGQRSQIERFLKKEVFKYSYYGY